MKYIWFKTAHCVTTAVQARSQGFWQGVHTLRTGTKIFNVGMIGHASAEEWVFATILKFEFLEMQETHWNRQSYHHLDIFLSF